MIPCACYLILELRARIETLDPLARAALAEALAGNMAIHIVYCRRRGEMPARPDPLNPDLVPVAREGTGADIARFIQPDGTMTMVLDGLRLIQAMPRLAGAILALVDGVLTVGEIAATLGHRGVSMEAFQRDWVATFTALEQGNRLFLRAR